MLTDLQTHWAGSLITALVNLGIFSGFPDRTFRPEQSMTRAEFAATLHQAFSQPRRRTYTPFSDVPASHWAAPAIRTAFEMQFLSGYPGNIFRPQGPITRLEVLLSLVSGLALGENLTPHLNLEQVYNDASLIPTWARPAVRLATQAELVVNYPDLQRFTPHRSATRGEVGAIIHQALVYLGRRPRQDFPYLVALERQIGPTVQVNHRREFRGAWVASVWNIDFPSSAHLPTSQQQAELIALLERLQALNFNAVILQVRPEGDALYASSLEPWSAWLTGVQGRAPEPFYDPLELAIAAGHQRGLEVHAWFNPYRARSRGTAIAQAPSHITNTHPQAVYRYGTQLWMDPGLPIVQERTVNAILDVVRRYDIDGVHLDDYFYPYPIADQPFPDQATYNAYRQRGGRLSLEDWRRDNVNQLVQRLAQSIKAIKPHVRFGISPFGIYRPGQPPGIQGLDQYNQLYADPKQWLAAAWVDYIAPQLYWPIDPPAQSYRSLLNWWLDQNPQMRHIYTGNNISNLNGKAWTISEFEQQVTLSRSWETRLSLGNIFYSLKTLRDNQDGIATALRAQFYQQPALPPVMQWLSTVAAPPPLQVMRQGDTIQWQADRQAATTIRGWTLYQQQGTTWELMQILPATATTVRVNPGRYALAAVNRANRESLGVVV